MQPKPLLKYTVHSLSTILAVVIEIYNEINTSKFLDNYGYECHRIY